MTSPIPVAASYRYAHRMARQSSSNFYRAFWLLPRSKRSAMCALYAFARLTDDLGDGYAAVHVRHQQLQWWRQATEAALRGEHAIAALPLPDAPTGGNAAAAAEAAPTTCDLPRRAASILPALCDAAQRFDIPPRHLLEIIDGVIADQQKTRFDTFEQLEHYSYLVASAVGLACLHIWQFRPPLPVGAAIDCGVAFQLTNILRDVREDAARGRIYLPRQHWEAHGLCEDDLLDPRPDNRLCCLVAEEAARAAKLFDSGWQVWDCLHPEGRPMFSMIWRTYRRLLGRIAADPGSVARHRVALGTSDRLQLISQHFFPPLFRRLSVPPQEWGR